MAGLGVVLCSGVVSIPIDLDRWPSSYFAAYSVANLAAGCFGPLVAWLWIHALSQQGRWSVCVLCAAAGLVTLWMDTVPAPRILWGSVCGPFFVLSALALPVRKAPALLNAAAACALPVYCVHVLFIEGIDVVAHQLHLGASLSLDTLTLGVTLVASFGFGWALQRMRPTNWFVALHR